MASVKKQPEKWQSKRLDSDEDTKVPNPFVNYTPNLTVYETVKIIVVGCVLLPVRLLLILMAVLWILVIAKISSLFLDKESAKGNKPLSHWRRNIQLLCRVICRWILFLLGYYWITVTGNPAPRKQAPVIVSNHRNFVDTLWLFYKHGPCFVGKAEISKWPIVGSIAVAFQTIFVSREESKSKVDTLGGIKKRATEEGWPQVVIFPEGTTTNGDALICYKRGGFTPGVPVQPVLLKYPYRHFDTSWCPAGPGIGALVLRTCCQFVNYMEVDYLDVYSPSENEKNDPIFYAENVRKYCGEKLKVPVTNHTFEDMLLMHTAVRQHEPAHTTNNFVVSNVKQLYQISLNDVKEMMNRFCSIDQNRDGKIDHNEFAALLGLPPSGYLRDLFKLFDEDGDGIIDFREFVVGLSMISKNCPPRDTIEMAFKVLDKEGKGLLTCTDLNVLLRTCFRNITMEEVQAMFEKIDRDHNGFIDHDEFIEYATQHPEYSLFFKHIAFAMQRGMTLGHSQIFSLLEQSGHVENDNHNNDNNNNQDQQALQEDSTKNEKDNSDNKVNENNNNNQVQDQEKRPLLQIATEDKEKGNENHKDKENSLLAMDPNTPNDRKDKKQVSEQQEPLSIGIEVQLE